MRFVVALLCLMLCLPSPGVASGDNITVAGMRVTVWRPSVPGKAPVILFSHGFHGCSTQSAFLMEAFAADGYIVFAPNHRDATCNGGKAQRGIGPKEPFGQPERWTDETYADRGDDIRKLVAGLKTDTRFSGQIDWSRMGLSGHSLGGYTVLALGGGIPSWKLDGVKAILAMSPYNTPLHHLDTLSAPVMYQGGSRDIAITPTVHKPHGAYDQSPSPKYFVEFDGAGHMAWTQLMKAEHTLIVAYSLAFMDRYLKEEDEPQLTQKMQGVTDLRHAP